MPSLIPRNDPRTAAPFSAFQMKSTFDSCRPRIRLLKLIMCSLQRFSVDSILVKPEAQPALFGRCRYRDNDQRAFETTQHPGERVLA